MRDTYLPHLACPIDVDNLPSTRAMDAYEAMATRLGGHRLHELVAMHYPCD